MTGSAEMMSENYCPFCDPEPGLLWFENRIARVIRDAFPISRGHTLVVPKVHIPSLFDLQPESQAALWSLVGEVRQRLTEEVHPDGFNVGLNDGQSAGQTVMHAHIHVIPRSDGDVPDPRGGVRWIIPKKARYWGEE